jgi:outer membrane immunogenic protein
LAPRISVSGNTSGFLGGAQAGCDYQFAPNWVVGIEAAGSAADINGDISATIFGVSGTGHARSDWIANATGRLGWGWDRWLLYGKGGVASVGDKYSADVPQFASIWTPVRPGQAGRSAQVLSRRSGTIGRHVLSTTFMALAGAY